MKNQRRTQFTVAIGAIFLLCCCGSLNAFGPKGPTAWWPDPATGLMWTNTVGPKNITWDEANSYCSSLTLGGFSGWRMPTLDETKTAMSFETFYPGSRGGTGHSQRNSAIVHDPANAFPPDPYDDLVYKGGLATETYVELWTSTKVGDSAWTIVPLAHQNYYLQKVTSHGGLDTFCVRAIEPDLLQLAKDAQAPVAVADVQTLKAYVPIAQAHASFKAGQYQAAMTEANGALAIEPKFAPAYWAMGVSAGMLGQWDQAVANLQSSVKIDKNYNNGKAALKWAEDGQKAAKNGQSPKDKPPVWE
jgi:hypothetical protein